MKFLIWAVPAFVLGTLIAAPFVYAPGASAKGMPPLADGLHFTRTVTRTVDVPLERLRKWLGTADINELVPGSRFLPSVTETRPLSGVWGQAGASRRVFLSDGSTVLETFIVDRAPNYSSYYFTPESGPARRLVDYVRGEAIFTALPGGRTHIEWRYSVKPRSSMAALHSLLYSAAVQGLLENVVDAIEHGAEAAETQVGQRHVTQPAR